MNFCKDVGIIKDQRYRSFVLPNGSTFGNGLAEALISHAHNTDLQHIMNKFSESMSDKEITSKSASGVKQAISVRYDGWSSELYFNPGYPKALKPKIPLQNTSITAKASNVEGLSDQDQRVLTTRKRKSTQPVKLPSTRSGSQILRKLAKSSQKTQHHHVSREGEETLGFPDETVAPKQKLGRVQINTEIEPHIIMIPIRNQPFESSESEDSNPETDGKNIETIGKVNGELIPTSTKRARPPASVVTPKKSPNKSWQADIASKPNQPSIKKYFRNVKETTNILNGDGEHEIIAGPSRLAGFAHTPKSKLLKK